MLIRNFNNKHTSGSQRITTTAIAAQVQINAKSNKNTTDNVISLIKQVLKFPDYYIINWKNGGSLILYFNGGYEKYNCNGKFANGGGVGSKNGTNAGNLSEELKIADSDRCNGYTLKYSLENIDKGVAEELYKPIAMAADKGIITTETRWNEGITKSEAIEIVVNAFMQYYDEQGYLVNSAEAGSTQALEVAAEALWGKQDPNDMSCTKEEFIADYIKLISDGMSPEEFEEQIEARYSIKFKEEQAAKEKQAYLDQIWDENKDKLTCDKDTFIAEYNEFTKDLKPEEISEREFIEYMVKKYGKPEETKPAKENNSNSNSNSGGSSSNSNGGGSSSSNNNYTPPSNDNNTNNNDTPSYTPPSNDNNNNGGGFEDNGNYDGGPSDWQDDLSGGPSIDPDPDNWIQGGV